MSEVHDGWPEQFDLFPRLTKLAKFIGNLLSRPHPLATHGDHFINPHHSVPFEEAAQLPLWDDMGCYYEGDVQSLPQVTPKEVN